MGLFSIAGEIVKEIVASVIAEKIFQTKKLNEKIEEKVKKKSEEYGVNPDKLRNQTERIMDTVVQSSDQFSYKPVRFHKDQKELVVHYDKNNPDEVMRELDRMLVSFYRQYDTSALDRPQNTVGVDNSTCSPSRPTDHRNLNNMFIPVDSESSDDDGYSETYNPDRRGNGSMP